MASQSYAEVENGVIGVVNLSNDLADILHRGANELSELEGADVIRFMAFQDQLFKTYLSGYVQWKTKTLDDRLWNTLMHSLVSLLKQPGQQEWWELRRHWYDSEFQEYVDRSVAQTSGKAMHPRALNG